jgi:protease I
MNKRTIMSQLTDFRVAVLATSGFEESELTEPVKALREAGAQVTILSLKPGQIQGVHHDLEKAVKVKVDRVIRDVSAVEFDAVHLPGGTVNADSLRMVPEVQAFLRAMQDAGKPVSAICHAPWELVSAGLVRGRKLTSYHTIQDDIHNAGGHWMDREVVEDGNWVTSRQPDDLPAFNRARITAGGAKGHWTGGWCQKPRVPPDASPTTEQTLSDEISAVAAYKLQGQRRSRLTARLEPYWGKPAVRNLRGGGGNEVNGLVTVCHDTRKGGHVGSHWPNHVRASALLDNRLDIQLVRATTH